MTIEQTYLEHTIRLSDEWRFEIEGPLVTERTTSWFESASEARTKIEELTKGNERQTREKMNLPVLLPDGTEAVISGIHGAHYYGLGVKNESLVYPREPWVLAALRQEKALRNQLGQVRERLGRVAISTKQYASRTFDGSKKAIETAWTEASERATKMRDGGAA